jgi:hypothetical protein
MSDRAEEIVLHDGILLFESPKQEPDRIFGLQETKSFQAALDAEYLYRDRLTESGKLVRDNVRFSPFPERGGNPLLYPFLIYEAKSEKGRDNFDSAEVQTALPIRTLLKLQSDLQKKQGNHMEWRSGPLVWFFSNKGEAWRVYAGFISNKDGEIDYVCCSPRAIFYCLFTLISY